MSSTIPYRTVDTVSKELVDGFIRTSNEVGGWSYSEGATQRCSRVYHTLFHSITEFLAKVKSTEGPGVALTLEDADGNFQFAGIVKYHANEDEELPGNWSYSFTFDPADLKDLKVFSSNSVEFKSTFIDIAEHYYGIGMAVSSESDEATRMITYTTLIAIAVVAIKAWVDENAISKDPVATEIKGKVVIDALLDENGHKLCSITPSGDMKNIIKDDASVEPSSAEK